MIRKQRRKASNQRISIAVDILESRDLMTADTLGVFAIQQGTLASPNQSVSEKFLIQRDTFRASNVGPIMLRLETSLGSNQTSLGPINLNSTQNPVGRRALTSTWQSKTGDGGLLARVRNGSYVLSAGYGASNLNGEFTIDYRLAGDVDGSFHVTAQDLALIRSGIKLPSSLTPEQFANADVDGSGVINSRDLQLARSNLGAATHIRPLTLDAAIGAATPHHNNVVRVSTGQIVATTSTGGASVIFTNTLTGEQLQRYAGPSGQAQASLHLEASKVNRIDVSATDTFGQSLLHQVIVDQRPTPVVILPGYTASLPKTLDDIPSYFMQLGYPADKLAVIPKWAQSLGGMNEVYSNIQVMLTNAGYVNNVDQFLVPYDWRIPIAPNDGIQDGVLSLVTGSTITQAQPQFSLGYLGNFLKNLVETDPSVVQIDMMGHSNGGLMTRSYIQSLAYGATITDNGETYKLPTVDKTFLLAAPTLGASMAWAPWNNDIASFTLASTEVIQLLLYTPYDAVINDGATIQSPLGNIDLATITDPITQQPDPLKFLRLYASSLRDLLPTYDFLYTTGGQLTNINSDSASANNLLLDINATSAPGVNPWTSKVTQVTATYGVYPDLSNNLLTTQTTDQTVIADGTTGTIWPFQVQTGPITPAAGTIYYTVNSIAQGDSTVPFVSQVATYANDPAIMIVQWGNGSPKGGLEWTNTAGVVIHASYITNSDVLELLRKRLLGLSS
jgi:triacylglycerol esterase/lipase EstA (alpha/beta hydrolase family)